MRIRTTGAMRYGMLVIILTAVLTVSGCSGLKPETGPTTPTAPGPTQPPELKTVYLDFGDVLLPESLKVDKNDSFVFSTAGLTAGVLSLKGRVESGSLITFFENRMPDDGWLMISAIKAERSMLLFKKQARWCVIGIEEGQMSTSVEIWVAPTLVPDSKLRKK